jgi:hypothetical protein
MTGRSIWPLRTLPKLNQLRFRVLPWLNALTYRHSNSWHCHLRKGNIVRQLALSKPGRYCWTVVVERRRKTPSHWQQQAQTTSLCCAGYGTNGLVAAGVRRKPEHQRQIGNTTLHYAVGRREMNFIAGEVGQAKSRFNSVPRDVNRSEKFAIVAKLFTTGWISTSWAVNDRHRCITPLLAQTIVQL